MTNLTEAWHKGELPEDFYYVISDSEFIKICYVKQDSTDYIKWICSKVPSYKEYQLLKEWRAKGNKGTHYICAYLQETEDLRKENTKLKELLKEVQSKIRYSSPRGIETFADLDDTLLAKINQVLGDKTDE